MIENCEILNLSKDKRTAKVVFYYKQQCDKYKKTISRKKTLLCDIDENFSEKENLIKGSTVSISSCRPVSKLKFFKIVKFIK